MLVEIVVITVAVAAVGVWYTPQALRGLVAKGREVGAAVAVLALARADTLDKYREEWPRAVARYREAYVSLAPRKPMGQATLVKDVLVHEALDQIIVDAREVLGMLNGEGE